MRRVRNAECGMDRATIESVSGFLGSNLALQFSIPHSALRIRVGRGR